MQGSPCRKLAALCRREMRPHFFLFRQKEIAAPGERKPDISIYIADALLLRMSRDKIGFTSPETGEDESAFASTMNYTIFSKGFLSAALWRQGRQPRWLRKGFSFERGSRPCRGSAQEEAVLSNPT